MAGEKYNRASYNYKGGGDAVYAFGLAGAAVFYIQQASGFGEVIVALLKAFVWPAFTVYDLLKFIT